MSKVASVHSVGNHYFGVQSSCGWDAYAHVTFEEETTLEEARDWAESKAYSDTGMPGGLFCTSVTVLPWPGDSTKYVVVAHMRYDN